MNTEQELLPCPFCGGEAIMQEHPPHQHSDLLVKMGMPEYSPGGFTIECVECECGMIHESREGVIAAWNRRAALQSQKPKGNDIMLSGVIRMPFEMAMADPISRMQFYQRAQQALNELESLQHSCKETSQDREDAEEIAATLATALHFIPRREEPELYDDIEALCVQFSDHAHRLRKEMTNTVLTNEQIRNLGEEWSCFFPEVGYEDDCIRDIEQAVLQSPEIQALKKDAERYRWLRNDCLDKAPFGELAPVVFNTDDGFKHDDEALMGDDLDVAIDHARNIVGGKDAISMD